MFHKIAIFGILLIILVLIIVFIIIGLFRGYAPLTCKLGNKPNNKQYSYKQYGGALTIKDKYSRTLDNLENTFSKIKSMMLYYDYDHNIATGAVAAVADGSNRDNTIVGKENQYRILSYMAAKVPALADTHFIAIGAANVMRLTPYNIIPGVCDFDNLTGAGIIAPNTIALTEAQCKQIFENVKSIDVPANPLVVPPTVRYFSADSRYISVFNYHPNYQPYKSLFITTGILADAPPWQSQNGLITYFEDQIDKVIYDNTDPTKPKGIKSIYDKMTQEIDYFKSLDNNSDIDYLFKAIKAILARDAATIADALSRAYSKSGANDDGDGENLPINENQLSSMLIDYINNSQYSQQIINILTKIIRLMEYKYSDKNRDWINIYIKILCELIRAEKKNDNKSLKCMLDLYHIFFDPIGETPIVNSNMTAGNIISHNNAGGNLNNNLIDIIISLIKTYQFKKKDNNANYYRNILGYNKNIQNNQYNLYDNIGLRFTSLYRTTKTSIDGNSIEILNDTPPPPPPLPPPVPLVIQAENVSINQAINIEINAAAPETFNTLADPTVLPPLIANRDHLNNLLKTDLYAFKEYNFNYNAAISLFNNKNDSLTPIFYKLAHTGNKYYFYIVNEIFNSKYFYAKYLIQKMMISKNFIAGLGGFVRNNAPALIHYTFDEYKKYVEAKKNVLENVSAGGMAADPLVDKDFLYINAMYAMNITKDLAHDYNITIAAGANNYTNIANYETVRDAIVALAAPLPITSANYTLYIETYQKLLPHVLYDNILIDISNLSKIDNDKTIESLLYKIYKLERFHFNTTPSLTLLTKKITNLWNVYKMNLLNAADVYADINRIVNMTKTLEFAEFQRPNLSNYIHTLLRTKTDINWANVVPVENENYYSFKYLIDNIQGAGYYTAINNFVKHNNILYLYKQYFDAIKVTGTIGADIDLANFDFLQLSMKRNDHISAVIYLLLAPETAATPALTAAVAAAGIIHVPDSIQKHIINDFNAKIYNDDHESNANNKKYPSKARNSIITSNIFRILLSAINYDTVYATWRWENMTDNDNYSLNNAYITGSTPELYNNPQRIDANFDARGLFYSMMKTNLIYKTIIKPPVSTILNPRGPVQPTAAIKKAYSDIGVSNPLVAVIDGVITIGNGDDSTMNFTPGAQIPGVGTIFNMNQYYYTNYLLYHIPAILPAVNVYTAGFFPYEDPLAAFPIPKNLFTIDNKIDLILCGLYNYTPYVDYAGLLPFNIKNDILRYAFRDIYNQFILGNDLDNYLNTTNINTTIYNAGEVYAVYIGANAINKITDLFNGHIYANISLEIEKNLVINLLKILVKYKNKSVRFYLSFIHEALIDTNEATIQNEDALLIGPTYLSYILLDIGYFKNFCAISIDSDTKVDYIWHRILTIYPHAGGPPDNKLNRAIELIPILDIFYKSVELDMYLYQNTLLEITRPILTDLHNYISTNINNNNDHHMDIVNPIATDSDNNATSIFTSFIGPYIAASTTGVNIDYNHILPLALPAPPALRKNKSKLINGFFNIININALHTHIGRECILYNNMDVSNKIERRINCIFNDDYTNKKGENIIRKLKSISMGEYYEQWNFCKEFIFNSGANSVGCDAAGTRYIFGDLATKDPPMSVYHRLVETIKQICIGLSFHYQNNTMVVNKIMDLEDYLKTDPAATLIVVAAPVADPAQPTMVLQNQLLNLSHANITAFIKSLKDNAEKGQSKIGGSSQNSRLNEISKVFKKNSDFYIKSSENIKNELSKLNWKSNPVKIWINSRGAYATSLNAGILIPPNPPNPQIKGEYYKHIQIKKKETPLFEIQKSENKLPNGDDTKILQPSLNGNILKSHQKNKNFKIIGIDAANNEYILYDSTEIGISAVYKYISLNMDEYWIDEQFFSISINNDGYRSGVRIDSNGNTTDINIKITNPQRYDIYDNIPVILVPLPPPPPTFTIIHAIETPLYEHKHFFIYSINGAIYTVKLLPILDSHDHNNIFKSVDKITDITIANIDTTIFKHSPTLMAALTITNNTFISNKTYADAAGAPNQCNYNISDAENILYKPEAALFWGNPQLISNDLPTNEISFDYFIATNVHPNVPIAHGIGGAPPPPPVLPPGYVPPVGTIKDITTGAAIATGITQLQIRLDNDFTYEYNIKTGKNYTMTEYFIDLIRKVGAYRYELTGMKELNYYAEKNTIFYRLIETLKTLYVETYVAPVSWYDLIDDSAYELDPADVNPNESILTELQRKIERMPDLPVNIISRAKDRVMGLNFRPSPKSRFNPKKHTIEEILKRIKKGDDVFEGHYWVIDNDYFSRNQELVIGAGHKKKQIKNK
jgi:hypothetical protein